jgi:catechol 2,3-dioxygenase-like lactoylglutathione lyase family enzyme
MRLISAHHIALYTPHFAQLREFYVETLGLPVRGEFPGYNILFLGAGDTTIELTEDEHTQLGVPRGWNHLAWEVKDLDEVYAELTSHGVSFQGPPEGFPPESPSMRIAFLTDPDGNILELIQPLGSRFPTARVDR